MSTYQKADREVLTMATGILEEFESHKPLVDAKVKIDFIFAFGDRDDDGNLISEALMLHGKKALGITRKLPLKDRVMGRGDAEILIDGDWWKEAASEEMQRALLDHELHHVALKITKGQLSFDSEGRPMLRLRKHDVDVGWFALIADRHGKNSIEQMQAKAIMDSVGQFFWPLLAPSNAIAKTDKSK